MSRPRIDIPRKEAAAAGFWTKKGLGQHLLRDPSVVEDIVKALAPDAGEGIVEIGPGLGALTEALLGTGCPVLAIEVDEKACQVLSRRFAGNQAFHLVQADVLECDLEALIQEHLGSRPFHIAANLPYYITTPILARVLEGGVPFGRMVVLAQREVASRLAALPGGKEYGALSLMAQYRAEVVFLRKVLPGAFTPPPRVDSGLVLFKRLLKARNAATDEAFLFRVIRASFGKRRKTLRNALLMGELGLEAGRLDQAFQKTGLDSGRRAETLELKEFVKLADALLIQ